MYRVAQILILVSIFVAGMGIGWILTEGNITKPLELILPAIATLFAAYFGATYAFNLSAARIEKETIDDRVARGNHTLFTIVRILSKLLVFERDFIRPYRDNPAAFSAMPPLLEQSRDEIPIDIDSLAFLLESGYPNLLGEISVGVSKYLTAIDAINLRSKMHREILQPKLHASGVREGMDVHLEDIKEILGELDFVTINMATEQVIEHVPETIEYLRDISDKLAKALKELFPNRKIIKLAMPDAGNAEPQV